MKETEEEPPRKRLGWFAWETLAFALLDRRRPTTSTPGGRRQGTPGDRPWLRY